ncbi:hypothetical protein LTR62_005339 [Meristemomyces frigidus]|uniref:NADPH-dependent FMN reductase-like domain-containing protein n=1 Tax=Meristemomyces frigidus TaxID=1508187 RepID=A0AAN7TDS6_9PEZI|nr:hypothetical protein LTR62_005339 [Meristemomyces frigidus]
MLIAASHSIRTAFTGPFRIAKRASPLLHWKPTNKCAPLASMARPRVNGDLNNTEVLRETVALPPDPAYAGRTLAIPCDKDDESIRAKYRPFLYKDGDGVADRDWVAELELSTALKLAEADLKSSGGNRLRVLVLFGSLRARSYSRLLALESARILFRLGCDVRVYDPAGLPVKDDNHDHPKVQELRNLSKWSDGHVWISPEQHGNLTAVFKNQIDWIPLSTGSVRPTQGRTLCVAQVSGGSQSFNTVNSLRILGRWMRMFTIPNQSSIPMAYKQFTDAVEPGSSTYVEAQGGSRLMPSGNRDRLVDCMEEFVKYTMIMREHFALFNDRYSERTEREAKRAKEEMAREMEQASVAAVNGGPRGSDLVNGIDVAGI